MKALKKFIDDINHVKKPVAMADLDLPTSARVLVFAPHPDDFDAVAVALRHLRDNGDPIQVIVATSGASGVRDDFVEEDFHGDAKRLRVEKGCVREREQTASCRFFGLEGDALSFLRLSESKEGHPAHSAANEQAVANALAAAKPDLLFTPHGNDTNDAHRWIHSTLSKAIDALGEPVVWFLNEDPKTIELRRDVFAPFDEDTATWKARLLRFHASQHQRNQITRGHGFDDRILKVNRKIGESAPFDEPYAEAFELAVR